jgi:hypothetical protein
MTVVCLCVYVCVCVQAPTQVGKDGKPLLDKDGKPLKKRKVGRVERGKKVKNLKNYTKLVGKHSKI